MVRDSSLSPNRDMPTFQPSNGIQHRRELRFYKRHALATLPCCFISIACLVVTLALLGGILGSERQASRFNALAPKVAALLSGLTAEEGQAVQFLSTTPIGSTDVDRALSLLQVTASTRAALVSVHSAFEEKFPGKSGDDSLSALLMISVHDLEDVQIAVRQRALSPAQAVSLYERLKQKTFTMLIRFSSLRAPVYLQTRMMAFVATQVDWLMTLYEAMLDVLADDGVLSAEVLTLMADIRNEWRSTAALLAGFGAADSELNSAITRSITADDRFGEFLMDLVELPSNWTLNVAPSATPPKVFSAAYIGAMQQMLGQIKEASSGGTTNPHVLGLAYGGSAIVVLCVAGGFVIHQLMLKIIGRDEAMEREATDNALSSAYNRMERFVTSVWSLQIRGSSAQGNEVRALHPAERELYTLEAPARSLLKYLHPALSLFRVKQPYSTSPVPRQLISRRLTVVLVDLGCLHQSPTAESLKAMPEVVASLFGGISSLVEQAGGCLHEVSGDRMVVAWNLSADCVDSESVACHAVTNIYRTWCTDATPLRFAVVTGDALVGVVGTTTFKALSLQGSLLQLGVHLLKLNKVHECAAIIDDVTFSALETQTFRAKPIEIISLADKSKGVAYELIVQSVVDRDGRMLLWNEGFEEYKSLALSEAANIFLQYRDTYGGSASLHRILGLLMSDPPRSCVSINEEVSTY